MKRGNLLLIALLFLFACKKKEDRYFISAQSATLNYADTGRIPYVLNYSLVLKSIPAFTTFDHPVLYPDGHYEFLVTAPYEINPGSTELYLYDSLEAVVDQFTLDVPAPLDSKEAAFQTVSFSGAKYFGKMTFKYSPVK